MRLISVLLLSAALTGCATGVDRQAQEFNRYVTANKPRAEMGEIKWSEFYLQAYYKAVEARFPGFVWTALSDSRDIALQYEAGAITKEQFDSQIRAARVEFMQKDESHRARTEAEQIRRQEINLAQLQASLQMMQASQPVYQPPPPPQPEPQTYGNAYITGYAPTQTVNGSLKYCKYSNGQIITVAVSQVCPVSTR